MKYVVDMGSRCHAIYTKFRKDWYRYSKVDTQTDDHITILLFISKIREVGSKFISQYHVLCSRQ
jgi:hypothetical protein